MEQLELRLEVMESVMQDLSESDSKLKSDVKMMGADIIRMQRNMEKLFEFVENLETRISNLEEEYNRWDFGYDPVETLARKIEEHRNTDLWKLKFAMDKPDGVQK